MLSTGLNRIWGRLGPALQAGRRGLALLVTVLTVALAGCEALAARATFKRDMFGIGMDPVLEKPEFVFPAADGSMYDFRKETDGDVALLFFGYTHCPDVCPMHMQNLSAVLKKISDADARRVHVLFITTDPVRDSLPYLRDWLLAIDPRIVGLRPSEEEAIRLQSALGIQPAVTLEAKAGAEGNYDVVHAAQIIAFTPDNRGRYAYPFGVRQTDWAHDIPLLLEMSGDRN
jgi:protein SCO1/2